MLRNVALFCLATVAACCVAPESQGAVMTYGFAGITDDPGSSADDANVLTGESQMFVQVSSNDLPSDHVRFTFWNYGGSNASSLSDVYFDDGSLLSIAWVEDGWGTDIDESPSPLAPDGSPLDTSGLPGDFSWNLEDVDPATMAFGSDSSATGPGIVVNGANPYEYFSIVFELKPGQDYDSVIDAIEDGIGVNADTPGILRIAVRVNGFESGGTELFLLNQEITEGGPPILPEPASMAIWSLGLALVGGVGVWRRRRVSAA